MTDTAYMRISTVDLAFRHDNWGNVVIYSDSSIEQVETIVSTPKGFAIQTDQDTYVIPRSDRLSLMWKVLA